MKHSTRVPLHRRPQDNSRVLAAVPDQRRPAHLTDDAGHQQRWEARPHAARAVRFVIIAIPLIASVGCALVVGKALPYATGIWSVLLWWSVVVGSSMVAFLIIERLARQLMPLAVLLRLTMLFPDKAPKRYKVAARAWSSRRLQEEVARQRDPDGDPSLAAATNILALMANLAAHDKRTRGHCERVRAYNDLLAEELRLSSEDRDRLRWAALIHDIGKLKVSNKLLNKPAPPTASEWEILRAHPLRGAEIAAPLAGWLGPWANAIEEHHERWDGSGYPHGLSGHEISLGARVVAVADAFEVMTSFRPYARPVSAEKARTELAECAGTQFDPLVVRAFLNISLGPLRRAMGMAAALSSVPLLLRWPRLSHAIRGGGPVAIGAAAAAVVAIGPATIAHDRAVVTPALASAPTVSPPSLLPPDAGARPANTSAKGRHPRTTSPHAQGLTATRLVAPSGVATAPPPAGVPPTAGPVSPPGGTVSPPPPASPPPTVGGRSHGRCAGNAGAGVGNGGSAVQRLHGKGGSTSAKASGLHACAA